MAPTLDQTIRELTDRLNALSPSAPEAELRSIQASFSKLTEDAPIAVAILLRECSNSLQLLITRRATDPAATLAAAVRFAKASVSGSSDSTPTRAKSAPAPAPTPAPPPPRVASVLPAASAPAEAIRNAPKEPVVFEFDENDRELVSEFVHEALDYVEQAEGAMLVLEGSPEDTTAVDTVFRAFHTVKGVSAMLGLEPIAKLAHKAESLLSRVRSRDIQFSGNTANLALASVDAIKALIQGVQAAIAGEPWACPLDLDQLAELLVAATQGGVVQLPAVVASVPSVSAAVEPEVLAEEVASAPALLPLSEPPAPPAAPPEPESVKPVALAKAPEAKPAKPPAAPEPSAPAKPAASPKPVEAPAAATREPATPANGAGPAGAPANGAQGTESSVRVRTERLDRLVDMVGELVIAHSMVRQDPTVVGGEHHDLSRKVAHAGKIVRELQELAMSLRMVPLKPTFQKMARVVRDTAQKSGKEVELQLFGEDTEIDRNMVDIVSDPLVHMLRNAVDHGVEGPAERVAKGKPRQGTVRLTASHSGGSVVVELADNGAGLDRTRIVKKAIERGLIESDAGMSDSDVYNLIFEPGFSTRDQVTDVSGRGVGMDVVRRNVQALNGRIEITSVLGQGTTFTLRLPLTLAVTDGMLVRVGSERYIVPTVNIQTSLRPTQENISTVSGRGELLFIRGELIPMFRLHRLFGVNTSVQDPTKALAVIVNGVEGRCALLVDELLGQQQVVAKSLGTGIGTVRGIAGGAILGDGRVGLILDTPEIIALARDEGTGRQQDLIAN